MLQLFFKGGPLMWPLLLVSLVALTTVFERVLSAIREKRGQRPQDVRHMLRELREKDVAGAIEIGEVSTDYRARCLATSLKNTEIPFAAAYPHYAGLELRRCSRGLPILDTSITIAPLLGLLGTVTGMIRAFGLMGVSELEAPAAITGGIAEALIATAFGLGIAITALLPFNWINTKMEKAQHDLQDIGAQVEPLMAALSARENDPIATKKSADRYAPAQLV